MEILHLDRKGKLMNTWERFHIYKLSKEGIQLNDTYADTHNPIFKIISNQAKKTEHLIFLPLTPTSTPFYSHHHPTNKEYKG
jgi:hypothetical protein